MTALWRCVAKLPVKTKTECEGICTRFLESIGGDLPVRSLTQAHIRNFKTGMLTNASKRTGQPVSPVTIKRVLAVLRAGLAWGKAEGTSRRTWQMGSRWWGR